MKIDDLKKVILSLPTDDRDRLLNDIIDLLQCNDLSNQSSRYHILDNKISQCPNCSYDKYVRFGMDEGSHYEKLISTHN